jgi:hypothetical protein
MILNSDRPKRELIPDEWGLECDCGKDAIHVCDDEDPCCGKAPCCPDADKCPNPDCDHSLTVNNEWQAFSKQTGALETHTRRVCPKCGSYIVVITPYGGDDK